MKIIGITGPTGAGKSLFCHYLAERDIPCIDADNVYHSMLIPPSECLDALRRAFGDSIFASDGRLDRAKLGAIVFNSPQKLELLNKTVLGRVLCQIRAMISDYRRRGFDTVAIDAPTLIESGFHKECTCVVSVLASPSVRKERIIQRDMLSEEKAELRIKAQKSDDFYRASSDFVLINDNDPEEFKKQVNSLLAKLKIK